jgi:hypothetical protein
MMAQPDATCMRMHQACNEHPACDARVGTPNRQHVIPTPKAHLHRLGASTKMVMYNVWPPSQVDVACIDALVGTVSDTLPAGMQ